MILLPVMQIVMSSTGAAGGLTGLTGWLADLIAAAGEVGVGLLTFLETVIPPIPSEVVLPLSGFLAQTGQLSLVWVLLASTAGSVLGALVFYALGAVLGLERSIRLLSKIPLLDAGDLHHASDWFAAHGRASVFFGRLVPGVRSLISLPAGAQRMSLPAFVVLTALGSGLWNSVLVGAGYAFATRWDVVGSWASTASNVVLGVVVVVFLGVLVRRALQRRASGGRTSRRAAETGR